LSHAVDIFQDRIVELDYSLELPGTRKYLNIKESIKAGN
jgi:hypothetical protein